MIADSIANLVRSSAVAIDPLIARLSGHKGLAPPTRRADFLARIDGEVLEIGPFDIPALRGERVEYFDILDTDGLRRRALELGRRPDQVPDIDYCSPVGDLSIIDRTFDAVFSSHVVEHQPDLIKHLNDVAKLLVPGGRYYVIAPDKRYCFDHFLPLSTTDDVVAAHRSKRIVPPPAAVLAHGLNTSHNRALLHWLGIHGRPSADEATRQAIERDAVAAEQGIYIDVHTWIFTPERFRDVVSDLARDDHIDLRLTEVTATSFAFLEYFAILERPAICS